jgi:hypothetical protein
MCCDLESHGQLDNANIPLQGCVLDVLDGRGQLEVWHLLEKVGWWADCQSRLSFSFSIRSQSIK